MRFLSDVLSNACCETHVAMLKREHFEIKETAVTIIAEDRFMKVAKEAIFNARSIIERKISDDPFFGTTYDPYGVSAKDDALIQRMCNASIIADIGPMATVAGAVAVHAVEAMKNAGASYAVVENGGDIAILCDRPVMIGLYSGDPKLDGLSVKILASDITGVCSSSGKIGPSVSFGKSDIVTVFSDDVILADAAATRLGNLVKDNELAEALEEVGNFPGIKGCIAYINGMIAMFGDIPELVRAKVSEDKITKISYDFH